jgi:hypothetical protein
MTGPSDRRVHLAAWAADAGFWPLPRLKPHPQPPRRVPAVGPAWTWNGLTASSAAAEPCMPSGPHRCRAQAEVARRGRTHADDESGRAGARTGRAWPSGSRMSPAERGRARLQFQEARQLAPGDRQERWEAYQALPADQRQALARKAQPSSPKTAGAPAGATRRPPRQCRTRSASVVTRATVDARAPGRPHRGAGPGRRHDLPGDRSRRNAAGHHQAGLPKIAATPGFVDQSTLLPKRGPQGRPRLLPLPAHDRRAGHPASACNDHPEPAWRRLAAFVYEGVLLFGVVMIAGLPVFQPDPAAPRPAGAMPRAAGLPVHRAGSTSSGSGPTAGRPSR